MSFKFNPTIKEYLEVNPHKTILGLAWSISWRMYLIGFAIGAVLGLMGAF